MLGVPLSFLRQPMRKKLGEEYHFAVHYSADAFTRKCHILLNCDFILIAKITSFKNVCQCRNDNDSCKLLVHCFCTIPCYYPFIFILFFSTTNLILLKFVIRTKQIVCKTAKILNVFFITSLPTIKYSKLCEERNTFFLKK